MMSRTSDGEEMKAAFSTLGVIGILMLSSLGKAHAIPVISGLAVLAVAIWLWNRKYEFFSWHSPGGGMPLSRESVLRVVERDFSEHQREEVINRLDQYDGPERERIHLDILQLAKGNMGYIRHYVEMASIDFRDVIVAAEYTSKKNQSGWLPRR